MTLLVILFIIKLLARNNFTDKVAVVEYRYDSSINL